MTWQQARQANTCWPSALLLNYNLPLLPL